jgi:hypothetical protein
VSDRARPDLALRELELLVRSLGEELASFRRRALDAERRLRETPVSVPAVPAPAVPPPAPPMVPDATGAEISDKDARIAELERENADLRTKLAEAAARTRQMVERVRFLRQQQEQDGER